MIETALLTLYGLCALSLALYTCGQAALLWHYWRHRDEAPALPSIADEALPRVVVQLPIYNEVHVIARLLQAVAALDYPANKLQVQILDDSDDSTAAQVAWQLRLHPHVQMRHIRREERSGYKAGALAYGLSQTDAPFVAIFDADFTPPPDFLRRTVPYLLADARLGVVQTRWGHLNRDENWLTSAQALAVDAHFIVEQTGRNRAGWSVPFNGTGGVWRVATIADAGGWSARTLTEDLDLSMRAQLRGWRALMLPNVVVPGELPPQVAAYRQQQARWSHGNAQNVRVHLAQVWRGNWSFGAKVMASQHLLQYLPQPLMLMLLLLTPPLIALDALQHLALAPLGLLSIVPPLMYALSQQVAAGHLRHVRAFPHLLLLGTGLLWTNSRAFIAGLQGDGGEFVRTPKFAQGWQASRYALRQMGVHSADVLLTLYALWAVWLAWTHDQAALLPYLLLYTGGFAWVTLSSAIEQWRLTRQPHLGGARPMQEGGD